MARKKTETRRREILEAAGKVFAARGYHAASVAHIAEEAGMGLGTFYRYFKNKLGIFVAVIEEVLAEVSVALTTESPTASESLEGYRAQVGRIGELLFSAFTRNRALARLLFIEAPGIDAALNAQLRDATLLFGAMTEAWLRHGVEKGYLREGLDANTTALAINAMIFEGVRQLSDAKSGDVPAVKARWSEAIVSLMFDGLGRK